jgi:hypothetical protein
MPVPPVPDSRRFAKHLTGIIHSELMEIPGVASQEMRLVRHEPLTGEGPTTCAEIDVASVSGSRARIVVYPLPPVTGEEAEPRMITPDVDVESLGLPGSGARTRFIHDHVKFVGQPPTDLTFRERLAASVSLATGRDPGQPVDSRDHLLSV